VLKGSYTTIIISVLLHLLLLITLTYGSTPATKVIKQDKPKVTSIKSFLYSAPKKAAPKKVPDKQAPIKKTPVKKIIAETKPLQKSETKKTAPQKKVINKIITKTLPKTITNPITTSPPAQVTNAVKSDTVTNTNKVPSTSRGTFSSYDRLSRLRKQLNNQQRDQAFAELTQKRSASSMDAAPFPVPKTLVPLTEEQKYKLNTSKSHVGSITKNDNGTCTIHREQILGSPVQATTSYFACGESKFDKSFREHMQKVQAKLPIKR